MADLSWLGGLLSGGFGFASNVYNAKQQEKWNQIQMEREDSAVQRRMADLQSAGLNPYLALSGGGQGASTGALNAPQISSDFVNQAQQGFLKKAEKDSILAGIEQKQKENDLLDKQNEIFENQVDISNLEKMKALAEFGLQFDIPIATRLYNDNGKMNFSWFFNDDTIPLTQANPFATSFERSMNIQKLIEGQQDSAYRESLVKANWANANQWLNAIYGGVNAATDVMDSFSFGKRAFNPVFPEWHDTSIKSHERTYGKRGYIDTYSY